MKKDWMDDCRAFILQCRKKQLPVYLERSRSGAGGHVWLFFDAPYPAAKSRRLFLSLLSEAGVISPFDKRSSFDRLFPNQDVHAGKGFGNLIALPLQRAATEKGNSCFVEEESFKPIPDQWAFLQSIARITTTLLDELLAEVCGPEDPAAALSIISPLPDSGSIRITLANQIAISRVQVPPQMISFLRESLNFANVEYIIKQKAGQTTYHTEPYFRTLVEKDNLLLIPRGFAGKLIELFDKQLLPYELDDRRTKLEPTAFQFTATLRQHQQKAVDSTAKKDFGVIVAPPGSGKTIMGLQIVGQKQQPALIVVHRKQLLDQWVERIQAFLGIPKHQIGKIENGKCDIGHEITVGMIQSLQSDHLPKDIYHSFGTIIVDECHHIPAKTFRDVIVHFHSYYMYGFTATPKRKHRDEELIYIHIGKIIHQVRETDMEPDQVQRPAITIRQTGFRYPFNAKTDNLESLFHVLIHDTTRNELILQDIQRELTAGRKVLVLTERKAHVGIILQYLKGSTETIAISGDDAPQSRKSKMHQIRSGNFQVLITTGQFLGEGADIDALDSLVLAFPFSFEGKLIQYIGRVQRGTVTPTIYDYRDEGVEYLETLFKQPNRYYRKLQQTGQSRPLQEIVLVFQGRTFQIHPTDHSLPVECLDLPMAFEAFQPGICWKVRVIRYDEENGDLFGEIVDYNFDMANAPDSSYPLFYFSGIEKIKFRTIDTAGLLRSVLLQKTAVTQSSLSEWKLESKQPVEHTVLKNAKVHFSRIAFRYGSVSFPLFIEELNQELTFEIENPHIRPEFEAIREYLMKALKKKLVPVEISVRFTDKSITSATATSADIDSINESLIESVRFEFVKKEIFRPKDGTWIDKTSTFDSLIEQLPPSAKQLFPSEQDLLNHLLDVKKCKHYQQLKYLSSRHESAILKLRFVLQPFSFIFLLTGAKKYHIVWETLDTEEATYLWSTEKTREGLRLTLQQIEEIITGIRRDGRQDYLKQDHPNFSRIWHEYSHPKKGLSMWKGMLEERLV